MTAAHAAVSKVPGPRGARAASSTHYQEGRVRTKTELFIGAAIALGLLLNAAIGVVRIFHPEPAVAQAALTDVNLVQISGKPLDVIIVAVK